MPTPWISSYELDSVSFHGIQKGANHTGSCSSSAQQSYSWASWAFINGPVQPTEAVSAGFVSAVGVSGYHAEINAGNSIGTMAFVCQTGAPYEPDAADPRHITGLAWVEWSNNSDSSFWSCGIECDFVGTNRISVGYASIFESANLSGGEGSDISPFTDTWDVNGYKTDEIVAEELPEITLTGDNLITIDSDNAVDDGWPSSQFGWSGFCTLKLKHRTKTLLPPELRTYNFPQLNPVYADAGNSNLYKTPKMASLAASPSNPSSPFNDRSPHGLGRNECYPTNAGQNPGFPDAERRAQAVLDADGGVNCVIYDGPNGNVGVVQCLGGEQCSSATPNFTPAGITATATSALNAHGSVTGLTIVSSGVGYTKNPLVTFSAGGGSGAAATAEIDTENGKVTGLTLSASGTGYYAPPTLAITSPKSTALATATVSDGGVAGITL